MATIHIDGASRGNPGPAAYAVVIRQEGQPDLEESATLGKTTNNVAEYTALVRALEIAEEQGLSELQIYSDSELMVKQMGGIYKVKSTDLQSLYEEAVALRKQFRKVSIEHVRREQNKRADFLCNEALDGRPHTIGETPPAPIAKSAPAAAKAPKAPASAVGDAAIRNDALLCLQAAAGTWAQKGLNSLSPEMVWEQIWSILEEGGVLRKKKS